MRGIERTVRAIVAVATLAAVGCASHGAPRGFLPDPDEVGSQAYGGWIDVTFRGDVDDVRIRGELIAANADTLWVLHSSGGAAVPTGAILDGRLASYDSNAGQTGAATFLGFLSTASNGVFLVFTGPMWLIGGGMASHRQSTLPLEYLPPLSWEGLAAHSRFPQGLPPSVDWTTLQPKPD